MDAGCRGVVVKRAINMRAVERGRSPTRGATSRRRRDGRRRIEEAGARTPSGYKVRMQFRNFTIPEVATAFGEIQLVAPDTVEFTRPTMPEAYR